MRKEKKSYSNACSLVNDHFGWNDLSLDSTEYDLFIFGHFLRQTDVLTTRLQVGRLSLSPTGGVETVPAN